jgi:uncharacterized protein YjeT (DUF2065 family)
MNFIVALVGGLIVAIGALGIVRPHLMAEWILTLPSEIRFYLTVIVRLLLGVLLIITAPRCRLPRFFYVLGAIILLAALALFFFGPVRLESIIRQISSLPNMMIRLLYVVTVLFGALLVYASAKPGRK